MANEAVLDQIEKGELAVAVDDARDPADIHKFTSALRTLLVSRLAALKVANQNAEMGRAFRVGRRAGCERPSTNWNYYTATDSTSSRAFSVPRFPRPTA